MKRDIQENETEQRELWCKLKAPLVNSGMAQVLKAPSQFCPSPLSTFRRNVSLWEALSPPDLSFYIQSCTNCTPISFYGRAFGSCVYLITANKNAR